MKMTKNPTVVNYHPFSIYKSAVVNYRWSVFGHFHVFLENNGSQKSNSLDIKLDLVLLDNKLDLVHWTNKVLGPIL
jgi:hypothetical protein